MATPEILDLATFGAPLPGDNPCGVDPRADASPTSLYYAIKAARRTAREMERLASVPPPDGQPPPPPADWRPVEENARKILGTQSRDLEVGAWLIEALVRRHGFAGLRDGFRLMRLWVEQFWDQLYPLPDAEGLAARTAPLAGLNGDDSEGTLAAPMLRIPVTEGRSVGPFSRLNRRDADAAEKISDQKKRDARWAEIGCSVQKFEKAVSETPPDFFRNLLDDIRASQEEFTGLVALLDEKCGNHSPPSSSIRNLLAEALDEARAIARPVLGKEVDPADAAAEVAAAEGSAADANGSPAATPGQIRTREDAYATLVRVAEFFRDHEPHNPISYTLEQAVRWSKMPLPDLLQELLPDKNSREQLFRLVGIQPPTS